MAKMFKGPLTSLDEDFKKLGIPTPISEEKKDKKLLKEKGKKEAKLGIGKAKKESRESGETLSQFLAAAKAYKAKTEEPTMGKVVTPLAKLYTGMDTISNLVEDINKIFSSLNTEAELDVVGGFETISDIYTYLGKNFRALGESKDSKELRRIGKHLSERADVAAKIAKTLQSHLQEGRGSQVDYARVEKVFAKHVSTVLEGLELFQELDAMMRGDDDHEEGHEDGEDGDEEPKMKKRHDDDGEEGEHGDGEEEESVEGYEDDEHDMDHDDDDDLHVADKDDGAPVKKHHMDGGDEGGEEDEESMEDDEDVDMDRDGDDGDDDDDDFLAHLKAKKHDGDEEEDEATAVEGDEDMEEDVLDTSDDSAKLLGKKVPQRDEDDEDEKGSVKTDNDAGHGGSFASTYPKGDGVMKRGKMESKGFPKGKARK